MSVEFLPFVLATAFLIVCVYVVYLKFREHLHAHRHAHDERTHHLVYVRRVHRRYRSSQIQDTAE